MKECLAFDDVRIEPKFLSTKSSRQSVSTETKVGNLYLKIPMIASPMAMIGEASLVIALGKAGGLGIIHRFMPFEEQLKHLRLVQKEGLPVVAAIGVGESGVERFDFLNNSIKLDMVSIDIANGYSEVMGKMIDYVKMLSPKLDIMAGNIASAEGYSYLAEKGVNAVRFGIGSGSRCITAIQTGINKPLFSTILECKELHKMKYPKVSIIGDGGIRYPSDLVLSIAAGADAIMGGSIFAGSDEATGRILEVNGQQMKEYYGMASFEHQEKFYGKIKDGIAAEGISYPVPLSGPIQKTIDNFIGGLKSAMTYLDAENLSQVRKNARFIRITHAAMIESHSVNTRR